MLPQIGRLGGSGELRSMAPDSSLSSPTSCRRNLFGDSATDDAARKAVWAWTGRSVLVLWSFKGLTSSTAAALLPSAVNSDQYLRRGGGRPRSPCNVDTHFISFRKKKKAKNSYTSETSSNLFFQKVLEKPKTKRTKHSLEETQKSELKKAK